LSVGPIYVGSCAAVLRLIKRRRADYGMNTKNPPTIKTTKVEDHTMTQQLNDQGMTEEEVENTVKYNALIRKVCMWEIRQGDTLAHYLDAVHATHAPDGARDIIHRLYGLRRKI